MDKGWYSHTVRILLAKRNPYLLTGNCGENHKLKAVGILSHIWLEWPLLLFGLLACRWFFPVFFLFKCSESIGVCVCEMWDIKYTNCLLISVEKERRDRKWSQKKCRVIRRIYLPSKQAVFQSRLKQVFKALPWAESTISGLLHKLCTNEAEQAVLQSSVRDSKFMNVLTVNF